MRTTSRSIVAVLSEVFFVLGLATLIVLPFAATAAISFSAERSLRFPPKSLTLGWYTRLLGDPDWLDAFQTSLRVGAASCLIALVAGLGLALVLQRSAARFRRVLALAVVMPIFLPVIVIALGSRVFFGRLGIADGEFSLVIVHSALALPYCTAVLALSLDKTSMASEKALLVCGVGPVGAFFHSTFREIRGACAAAASIAFLVSFDEPVVSSFLAGTRTVTLPKKLWDGIQYELNPSTAAASVCLVLITLGLYLATLILRRHSRGISRY